MNATVAWVLVSVVHSGFAVGPEFYTQQKCEDAAKAIQQAMAKVDSWGSRLPTCVRIQK